jgi:hypothetical protein
LLLLPALVFVAHNKNPGNRQLALSPRTTVVHCHSAIFLKVRGSFQPQRCYNLPSTEQRRL